MIEDARDDAFERTLEATEFGRIDLASCRTLMCRTLVDAEPEAERRW
jgi:hypothetical protein